MILCSYYLQYFDKLSGRNLVFYLLESPCCVPQGHFYVGYAPDIGQSRSSEVEDDH